MLRRVQRTKRRTLIKVGASVAVFVFILSAVQVFFPWSGYDISQKAETLLPAPQENLSAALRANLTSLEYNQDYKPTSEVGGLVATPRFSASFPRNSADGVTIVDPMTKVELKLKPKFGVKAPQKNENRVVYPLKYRNAQAVYTLLPARVKEDIILNSYQGDELTFDYKIELPSGAEARMEANGSVGVYSVSAGLLGDVTTGSDKDAKLLEAARENGEKSTLLFTIPAPFIKEYGKHGTKTRTWMSLNDSTLRLHASGLKDAQYPLSIDPTVYIDTAARLMGGNNESNIDFDVDNELIQKGKTTGGRFDSWTSTLALPSARWAHSTAVYGGYVYSVGGNNGSSTVGDLYWAKFNNSSGAIEATNPGSGACASWCTDNDYDLPGSVTRQGASLVAYNGYLYLFGGVNNAGTRQSTVYIAKLGANGEPQLWHPSDSDKDNWAYWYSDTALSSARSYLSAVAYNNTMYVIGGTTSGSTGGITTVERANITPTGVLTNWTSDTALPSARFSSSVAVYNDRVYVVGGANGTTTQNTVYVSKINSSTSALNSWQTTTAIGNGASGGTRASLGGSFATIWGGFLYVAGGCTTMNASGYCTSIANDIQLASINADGTITDWTTMLGITSTRMGYGLTAWRNKLYAIGGCTAQNTTTGACTSTATATDYGAINQDGDVSSVSTSVASGTSPCVSTAWLDCDLPPEGDGNGQGGRMSGATVVNNGYIYYFGGCTAVNSGSVCYTGNAGKSTDNVSYASIASDGNISRVASCAGSFVGSWCAINGGLPASISAFGYAVFNNTLYVIGGTTGVDWQANVHRTTFNSDGTWGAWTSQTFASVGLGNARGYMYSFTRANPSSASTYPGNIYVLGGCSGVTSVDNGLDCSGNMYTEVYKCNIKTDGSIENTTNTCTTTGQLQIDAEPGTGGNQGLGVMAGAVYANYIYMIGGQSPNESERGEVMYAKIDNSNNIVAVSGSTWITSAYEIDPIRRRGVAFGYNGYLYALAGYNAGGGGSLNDLLYAKINVSDGSISDFTTSSVTVSARWDLRAAVNNGYVYAIGGCSTGAPPASCTVMTGTVQTFQLYNNYSGSPKSYSAATQFATDRYGASSAVVNGYIYIAGGCTTTTDCTTATNSVQYASIGSDGTIGTWSATTSAMPAARVWGQFETVGGSLYYVGGQTSGSTAGSALVYYATPNGSGNITSWIAATNGLPSGRTQHGATVWNNRIYVVGGIDSGGSTSTNTVYVSPQLNSGGNITSAWSTSSTSFNVARSGATAIAYANNLYVLGGYDGTNYLNDVQFSQIDTSTGDAGSWTYTTSLPTRLRQADGFAANGFMYLFGGRSASTTCTSNTIAAPISANTTIATGNNPTGVGDWYATNVRYTGDRYGAAASYYDGKAYVMGGQCNGTIITTTNKVQQSTVQSQPQIAKYSRMIDTDTNVFPTKWLLNGIDNSIGARWQATYRSAYDSYYLLHHATFDQGTNGNAVTETTTAFDNCYSAGNGTNTYSNAFSVTPSLSMHVAAPGGGTGSGGCNDDFSAIGVRYDRFYVYFPSNPGTNTTIFTLTNEAAGDETIAGLRVTTSGTLQIRDEVTAEGSALALGAGAWHRIEVFADRPNTTLTTRVYSGANLHSTTASASSTITLNNSTATTFDAANVGMISGITTAWDVYIDDHKASSAFWPGSAFPPWGQTTSFGDVTLGTLNTFTPKDVSGANTSYARWYNMFTDISAEKTYGYPEDVSRGPTIADLSLFFTADPSKRLMHGRTFTGGEQQPIDAPQYAN